MDLYCNQYDMKTLKANIYSLELMDILKTQILDAAFVVKYILNESFQLSLQDKQIDINTVLQYQPHLSRIDLWNALFHYDVFQDEEVDQFDFQRVSEDKK